MPLQPPADQVAISYLATKTPTFVYTIYRKQLSQEQPSPPGTRSLPLAPGAEQGDTAPWTRYQISFTPHTGFEAVQLDAWTNPDLTNDILYQALLNRCEASDLCSHIELPDSSFYRQVAFTLANHAGSREVMWVRPYAMKSIGKFGLALEFALRVSPDSTITHRKRLELSLTHKDGRINHDYYQDHYLKVELFLDKYFSYISPLRLHDGSTINLERRLSVVPSFSLSRRVYLFGQSSESANSFFGLRDNEPFRKAEPNVRIVFVFMPEDRLNSQDLFRALRGDTYPTFPGMEKMFGCTLSRLNVSGIEVRDFSHDEMTATAKALTSTYPNCRVVPVAIVPMTKDGSDEQTTAYITAKHALLTHRLYSQFVDRKRLLDRNALKWSISNIGLALFAKMGGVPWRIKPSTANCLIVGIGQAHRVVDRQTERFFAYSVLSDSSGVYETIRVLGDSRDKSEYIGALKDNLRRVLLEHDDRYSSFVLHVTFKMKREELNAIRSVLSELEHREDVEREFVALKFNDRNSFFGFATQRNTRIPHEGTVARLSRKEFLVWFSGLGREDSRAPKKPERPVHVEVLHPRTILSDGDLYRLLQDAMNISGANWRGFNGKSMPISVYYAKLIADYYGSFRDCNLDEVKLEALAPWFL